MVLALTRFSEGLWLTCHLNTASRPVAPSDYLKQLLHLKRQTMLANYAGSMHHVCLANRCILFDGDAVTQEPCPGSATCAIDWCAGQLATKPAEAGEAVPVHPGYVGHSPWD